MTIPEMEQKIIELNCMAAEVYEEGELDLAQSYFQKADYLRKKIANINTIDTGEF